MNIKRKHFFIPEIKTVGTVVFFLFSTLMIVYLLVIGGVSRYSGINYIDTVILKKTLRKVRSIKSSIDSKVVVVSFSNDDYKSERLTKSKYFQDASIEEYVDVIQRIVKNKPSALFISLFRPSHEGEKLELLDNISNTFPDFKDKIFIVDSKSKIWSFSFNNINTVSSFRCGRNVSIRCRDFEVDNTVFFLLDRVLSVDIKKVDSYILNIYPKEKIKEYSFIDIKEGQLNLKDKVVFIGNNIIQQELKNEKDSSVLKRIKTLEDENLALYESTSEHIFLARVSRMLEEGRIITGNGAGKWILAFFVFGILYLSFRKKFLVSVVIIGCLTYTAPMINSWLIDRYNLYIPLGSCIYISMLSVLLIGIMYYFYVEYKNDRLKRQSELRQKSFNLKSNFISLVSHNLNTPISRLYSLLSLEDESSGVQREVKKNVAQMFFTVKYALGIRAVKENRGVKKILSIEEIQKSFSDNMVPLLIDIGIKNINTQLHLTEEDGCNLRFLYSENTEELVISAYLCLMKLGGYIQNDSAIQLYFSCETNETQGHSLVVSYNIDSLEVDISEIEKKAKDKRHDSLIPSLSEDLVCNYLDMCLKNDIYRVVGKSKIKLKLLDSTEKNKIK